MGIQTYAQIAIIKKDRTIRLPESLLLKRISTLDIDKQGYILICDNFNKKVLLLNPNGTLKKMIEYTPDVKNQTWEPMTAYFRRDGDIVVVYYLHGSILYDKNGSFEKPLINSRYYNKDVISYLDNGSLRLQSDGKSYFLEKADEKIKQELFRIYPKQLLVVPSYGLGGLTADQEGNVFFIEKFVPVIIKYSKSGTLLKIMNKEDSFFKEIKGKMPRKNDVNSLNTLAKMAKNASMVISLDYFADNKLFYQIMTNGKYYFQILDVEGNNLLENYHESDDVIARAKYNNIISVHKKTNKIKKYDEFTLVYYKVFTKK